MAEPMPRVDVADKLLLSVPEASALTGICERYVYRYCHDGTWPTVRVGVKWMIPRTSITRWIAEQTDSPFGAPPAVAVRQRRAAGP